MDIIAKKVNRGIKIKPTATYLTHPHYCGPDWGNNLGPERIYYYAICI